jgi:hypothetical protein
MYRPSSRLVAMVNRMVNPTARYSVPIGRPQNFSGRSMAYARYTKAAMLRSNDKIVMVSPTHDHTA